MEGRRARARVSFFRFRRVEARIIAGHAIEEWPEGSVFAESCEEKRESFLLARLRAGVIDSRVDLSSRPAGETRPSFRTQRPPSSSPFTPSPHLLGLLHTWPFLPDYRRCPRASSSFLQPLVLEPDLRDSRHALLAFLLSVFLARLPRPRPRSSPVRYQVCVPSQAEGSVPVPPSLPTRSSTLCCLPPSALADLINLPCSSRFQPG